MSERETFRRVVCLSWLLLWIFCSTAAARAQDEKKDEPEQLISRADSGYSRGSRYRSRGSTWTASESRKAIPGESFPETLTIDELRVEWDRATANKLGNAILLSGTILQKTEEGLKAITWRHPISVAVHKPEVVWDKDAANTAQFSKDVFYSDQLTTSDKGRFEAVVELESSVRLTTKLPNLAAVSSGTLYVGDVRTRTVAWSSSDSLIADSFHNFELQLEQLDEAYLRLLQACENADKVLPILRAVNALQKLGKEKAIETLLEYQSLQGKEQFSFQQRSYLFVVANLLFEPIELGSAMPDAHIFRPSANAQEARDWPLGYSLVVRDLPFFYPQYSGYGFSGRSMELAEHLDLVRKTCVLRCKPLAPSMDPILVIHQLEGMPTIRNSGSPTKVAELLRLQALDMLPQQRRDSIGNGDASWQEALELSQKSPVVWDANKECFVERGQP